MIPTLVLTTVSCQRNRTGTLKDRADRFGLVVASAAFAGAVVLAVLYTTMSERLKPTPKPSAESSQTTQATAPPAKQK